MNLLLLSSKATALHTVTINLYCISILSSKKVHIKTLLKVLNLLHNYIELRKICELHRVHYKGFMFLYILTILDERHSQLHVYNNIILNTHEE